jgi:transcriptional regulator GlxA family with amidase domain
MSPKRIGILGFESVIASHLTGPTVAFTAASLDNAYGGRIACYDVRIIGLTLRPFRAESGMMLIPNETTRTAAGFDTIIIPGGSGLRRPEISLHVSDWVLSLVKDTRRFASVCTGIYGLAPTGLLDNRDVTTDWRFASDVSRRFPKLKVDHGRRVVKDGPFFTSSGLTPGIDLSLAMIEEDYGLQVALSVRDDLVTYLESKQGDGEFAKLIEFDSHPRDRFAELVAWMVRNLHRDLSVDTLARRACMCPSHFSRAFKSIFGSPPAEFVRNLRLNEARRRLSTRGKALQSVAASVGFANPEVFHRAFARRFGTRPSDYFEEAVATRTISSEKKPTSRAFNGSDECPPDARSKGLD